jgi:hypothetical protein
MMKLFNLAAILLWAINDLDAQETITPKLLEGVRIENDTLPHVELAQVFIFPKTGFKSKKDEQQFWKLVWKGKKVYPYAKEAARLYQKYQMEIPPMAKRREKRDYVQKAEKELMILYGQELKKMSISEGRILIKLIDRETSSTSYTLIEEVKGDVPAVFWQGIARLFGNNLKAKYDPLGEDRQIEQIIYYIESGLI